MFKPLLKPKRTYIKDGKVFLTPEFKDQVRANRKKINNSFFIDYIFESKKSKSRDTDWNVNGQDIKYPQFYDSILTSNIKKPKIMILGPSLGENIPKIKRSFEIVGKSPEIDVFGLTKSIVRSARKIVRKDFSDNFTFEELWTNPEYNRYLLKEILGRYDFIEGVYSVGYHTNYPEKTSFFTALMLAKGGEAYLTINVLQLQSRLRNLIMSKKIIKDHNAIGKLSYYLENTNIPRLSNEYAREYFLKYLKLAVKRYNKDYNLNLDFDFEIVNTHLAPELFTLRIIRTN